jgi:uncharacterized protein (TIGR02145 family)
MCNHFFSSFYRLFACVLVLSTTVQCSEDTKITPVIDWLAPAAISWGTALGPTQLNATASVAGTFVYTPAEGSVLPEGINQTLSVTFTPDNGDNYESVNYSVPLTVYSASKNLFNPAISYGAFEDQQGNIYRTVTIGSQTWMAENLRTTVFKNGDKIPEVTGNLDWRNATSPASCTYGNTENEEDIASHGRLYNWFAVSDSRSLAPAGWHVATDADWKTLSSYLGGEAVVGGKLKETGTLHWKSPNTGGSNEAGFTAVPAGRREYTDGSFINVGYNTFWWTSSPYNPDYSWYRQVNYNTAYVNPANFHKQYGFSVRCVKDE